MIGKIRRISHVDSLVHYLTSKEEAAVLQGDSLLAETRAEGTALAHAVREEIHMHAPRRPLVERTAAHMVLSAPPGQDINDDQWRAVAREALDRLGYKDVPHVVIKHDDTAKVHVHVVAGTITRDGDLVNDKFEGLRLVREMRDIRREYGLSHEKLDDPREMKFESPSATEDSPRPLAENAESPTPSTPAAAASTDRAELIRDQLARSESLREFTRRLREAGIRSSWNISSSTGHVSGVSYRLGEKLYGGRRLGKDLAYGAIEKRFGRPSLADLQELVCANREAERGRTVVRRVVDEGDLVELRRDHGIQARTGDVVEISPAGIEHRGDKPEIEPIANLNHLNRDRVRDAVATHLARSQTVDDFVRRLHAQGIQPRFYFNDDGRPSGLAYRTAKGRWFSGTQLDHPWGRLRQQLKPTLQDLPVLLRANEAVENAATRVQAILEEPQIQARSTRAKAALLTATSQEVRLEPIVADLPSTKPSDDPHHWRSMRRDLRREIKAHLARSTIAPSEITAYERLIRASTYADGRLKRHLGSYRETRAELRAWRADLVAGRRTDVREYLTRYERFQRIRALRLHHHAADRYQRIMGRLSKIQPVDTSTTREWVQQFHFAHRVSTVANHYAPALKRVGKELVEQAAAKGVKLVKAGLVYAPVSAVRMGAEMAAETLVSKAFDLPDSARQTYRILRGRFTSVALSAAIKAIKADDGSAATLSLSAKATVASSRMTLRAGL